MAPDQSLGDDEIETTPTAASGTSAADADAGEHASDSGEHAPLDSGDSDSAPHDGVDGDSSEEHASDSGEHAPLDSGDSDSAPHDGVDGDSSDT